MNSFDSWDNVLCHHGVRGQKWGIRQYQNEDGSLTRAGEIHYGRVGNKRQKKDYMRGALLYERANRIRLTDSDRKNGLGSRDLKEQRAAYYKGLKDVLKSKPKNAITRVALRRVNRKLKAQEAANDARDYYDNHSTVAKLWVQNKLLGHAKSERYRDARARGSGRARSFVEAILDGTMVGTIMRRRGSKKAYGATVKW